MTYVMSLILGLAAHLNMPQRLSKFRGISHYQIDDKIVDLVDDGVVPKYALQKSKKSQIRSLFFMFHYNFMVNPWRKKRSAIRKCTR